jgi:hypothetical protein
MELSIRRFMPTIMTLLFAIATDLLTSLGRDVPSLHLVVRESIGKVLRPVHGPLARE